jgi:hypothetical protein
VLLGPSSDDHGSRAQAAADGLTMVDCVGEPAESHDILGRTSRSWERRGSPCVSGCTFSPVALGAKPAGMSQARRRGPFLVANGEREPGEQARQSPGRRSADMNLD